jgi:superfamily II DNA or RNA helicase
MSLRKWQSEALERWISNGQRGVVKVVTGGGKTVFALECAKKFLSQDPDGRIVVVVPTLTLVDQWCVEIAIAFSVGIDEIAIYSGTSKPSYPQRFCVITVNTARSTINEIVTGKRTFLIADECHHLGSAANRHALPRDTVACLGLSATPERERDDGFLEVISPALGDIIYEYDLSSARRDLVIVPFDLVHIRVEVGQESHCAVEQSIETALESAGLKSTERLRQRLRRAANDNLRSPLRANIACDLALQHAGDRVVVFADSIAQVNKMSTTLRAKAVSAAEYHSGMSSAMRREHLLSFRRGVESIMITCRALDEGANIPEADIAVMTGIGKGMRQRVQRMGRVLRTSNSKSRARIYTIYTTDEERASLSLECDALADVANVVWLQGGYR